MSPDGLTLEVVTPDGLSVLERGLDVVVLHRREPRFEVGSEIAVFPNHAPLLVRIPVGPARFGRAGETVHLALAGGFAEVLGDRVRVMTPRVERVPREAPDGAAAARALCRAWSPGPSLHEVSSPGPDLAGVRPPD